MAGYGTDDGFVAYVTAAGYTLPGGGIPETPLPDGSISAARQRGSAYIDGAFGYRFPGTPTGGVMQEREWPRTGAVDYYGRTIDPTAIPVAVVNASYEAAVLELANPGSLSVLISEGERLARVKAGSVEVEYANKAGASTVTGATPMSTLIAGMLFTLIGPANPLPGVLVV